jgi:catechol 2,3-dioxygenase-like lactoylglutathione lyase family enzyme
MTAMLATPTFHHLHLNSVDPQAAIDFYRQQFTSSSETTWSGEPALSAPNDVLIVFTQVERPPRLWPATAFWHFGWHVPDSRKSLEVYQRSAQVKLLPLYTSDEGDAVLISSDTYPGTANVLGLNKAQIAAAKASGVKPRRDAGFAYMEGPDGALVEYAGNYPTERFNHVHMWQTDPYCAQLWYQKHLQAPPMQGRTSPIALTEADCKVPRGEDRTWPALERAGMFRSPRAAVMFGDVALTWYPPQGNEPLVRPSGHLIDHIGLGVNDLDAWVRKLRGENIVFIREPYFLGDTRAVMIEGPSREALELVEIGNG